MNIEQQLKEIIHSIRVSTQKNEEPSEKDRSLLISVFLYLDRLNYNDLRGSVALISNEMHDEGTSAVPLLMSLMLEILPTILNKKVTHEEYTELKESDDSYDFSNALKNVFENFGKKYIRMSEFELPNSIINNEEEIYPHLRISLNDLNSQPLDDEDIDADLALRMMIFSLARVISKKLGYLDEVYLSLNSFIQVVNRASYHQLARDTCEEVLISSIIDKKKPYGLLIYCNCFVSQKNILDSLIYANTLLFSLIDAKDISKDLHSDIFFIVFTLLRNFHFFDIAEEIYISHLPKLKLNEYEIQKFETAFLYMQLEKEGNNSFLIIQKHLEKKITVIINYGVHAIAPVYNLLLNAKKIAGYNLTSLPKFEHELTVALGNDKLKYTFVPDDNDAEIKNKLIIQYKKLSKTRNIADLVSESKLIEPNANIALNQSLKNNDVHLFLLGQYLYSDLSIAFGLSEAPDSPMISSRVSTLLDNDKFDDYSDHVLKIASKYKNSTFVWLTNCQGRILYLTLSDSKFSSVNVIKDTVVADILKWNKDTLPEFGFEDTMFFEGENYSYDYFPTDLKEALYKKSFSNLPFLKMSKENDRYFIFMDNSLSIFPANLIRTDDTVLLSSKATVTLPLSFDNFSTNKQISVNTKKMYLWAPTQEGDYSINMAFSKIQDELKNYEIHFDEELIPDHAKQRDINLFIAHGSSGNEGLSGLYASDTKGYVADTIKIFGNGKVAILFICHSGSSARSLFFNKANSIIKKLLNSEYESVIAPAWSLNVLIPGVWSNAFFNSLQNNNEIDKAVFDANMKVKVQFHLPNAWACMHLFGNSNIKTFN